MSRSPKFENLTLLQQIEHIIKKQLPKDANLQQTELAVNYSLNMNVITEDNPFELTTKEYTVEATYFKDFVDVVIKDGDKVIKQTSICVSDE